MRTQSEIKQMIEEIKVLSLGGSSITPPTLPPPPEPSWMPRLEDLVGYTQAHLPYLFRASAARMDDVAAKEFRKTLKELAGMEKGVLEVIDCLTRLDRMIKNGDTTIEGGELRQLLTLSKDVANFLKTAVDGSKNA